MLKLLLIISACYGKKMPKSDFLQIHQYFIKGLKSMLKPTVARVLTVSRTLPVTKTVKKEMSEHLLK